MKSIEFMCTYCGTKIVRGEQAGRPSPGNCPRRKKKDGTYQPHRWVKNRTIG